MGAYVQWERTASWILLVAQRSAAVMMQKQEKLGQKQVYKMPEVT